MAVDEPPGDAAERHDRTPEAEEERGDRERRAGRTDVQGEQDPKRRVADGRDADGGDDQADVAEAEHGHGRSMRPARVRTVILP